MLDCKWIVVTIQDILIGMWWGLPSFLSKNGVKSYPGVGLIAESIQCLFLNRTGNKSEKEIAVTSYY
jgi:hypothetical protein